MQLNLKFFMISTGNLPMVRIIKANILPYWQKLFIFCHSYLLIHKIEFLKIFERSLVYCQGDVFIIVLFFFKIMKTFSNKFSKICHMRKKKKMIDVIEFGYSVFLFVLINFHFREGIFPTIFLNGKFFENFILSEFQIHFAFATVIMMRKKIFPKHYFSIIFH